MKNGWRNYIYIERERISAVFRGRELEVQSQKRQGAYCHLKDLSLYSCVPPRRGQNSTKLRVAENENSKEGAADSHLVS